MSRYMPARVRRWVTKDRDGATTAVYVAACPEHGVVRVHETHNGAHHTKAVHNRLPHTPPVFGVITFDTRPAIRQLRKLGRQADAAARSTARHQAATSA